MLLNSSNAAQAASRLGARMGSRSVAVCPPYCLKPYRSVLWTAAAAQRLRAVFDVPRLRRRDPHRALQREPIESLNARYLKAVTVREHFPTEQVPRRSACTWSPDRCAPRGPASCHRPQPMHHHSVVESEVLANDATRTRDQVVAGEAHSRVVVVRGLVDVDRIDAERAHASVEHLARRAESLEPGARARGILRAIMSRFRYTFVT